MLIDKSTVKKILVVRNDRFGEFLLNIPALKSLRRAFPHARISLVVSKAVKELAEKLGFIDEVIVWDSQEKHSLRERILFINLLKKNNFDIAIMLNPSKEFNVFTYLSGIPFRIGYDRKWGFLLTGKIKDTKYLGQKHEVEYNLELMRLAGVSEEKVEFSLPLTQQDISAVDKRLEEYNIVPQDRILAVHPWTSDSAKQWPQDRFKELIRRLYREFKLKVVLIGGKEEEIEAESFCDEIPSLINFAGKLSLTQSAALLKRSELLISNDSGPVHLAAAVNTPVLAIFSNRIPAKSSRRWGPWGKANIVIEKPNLADISVEEVMEKVRTVLKR